MADKSKDVSSIYSPIANMNLRTKTLLTIGLTVFILVAVVITSLFINSADITTNFNAMNQPPSFEHLFGTDWMGRDMFTRTMKGLGLSVQIGAGASILSSIIAIILAFVGSINSKLDSFIAWLVDLFLSVPHILLIILISIGLGGGAFGVTMGVALTHWTSLTRILRAEIKQINTSEFVKLSKRFGKSKEIHEPAVPRESDLQAAEHRPDRRTRELCPGMGRQYLLLHEERRHDHDRRGIQLCRTERKNGVAGH